MENKAKLITDRLDDPGVQIIDRADHLNRTVAGRYISMQLIRSGTSAGANYEEARAAESKKDFIHKIQVSLKELREAHYWLKIVSKSKKFNITFDDLVLESLELIKILSKSVKTAKNNNN